MVKVTNSSANRAYNKTRLGAPANTECSVLIIEIMCLINNVLCPI